MVAAAVVHWSRTSLMCTPVGQPGYPYFRGSLAGIMYSVLIKGGVLIPGVVLCVAGTIRMS